MALYSGICLDSLHPLKRKKKEKKNLVKVGTPLTKLSGSTHGFIRGGPGPKSFSHQLSLQRGNGCPYHAAGNKNSTRLLVITSEI